MQSYTPTRLCPNPPHSYFLIRANKHIVVSGERLVYSCPMHKTISTDELKKRLDAGGADFVLVDVLSKEKYSARHVPGAINIPETVDYAKTFEAALQVPSDREIIVYCSSGTCQASVRTADALEKAGYTNVVHYKDGIAGWEQAGFPFESANA